MQQVGTAAAHLAHASTEYHRIRVCPPHNSTLRWQAAFFGLIVLHGSAGFSIAATPRGAKLTGPAPRRFDRWPFAIGSRVGRIGMNALEDLFGGKKKYDGCVMGGEELMSQKAHGTSATPVQQDLRWNCDAKTADKICNFNRHYAE